MEILLPATEYNIQLLSTQYEATDKFNSLIQRGTNLYALIDDDATTPQQQAIIDIANNHDHTQLTAKQEVEAAKEAMVEGAVFSRQAIPLVKVFNDGPEAALKAFLDGGGTTSTLNRDDPLNQAYAYWRTIYETLDDPTKVRIHWHGYMLSHTFVFEPEPDPPSLEYKAWFNNALANLLGYITDRAQRFED